MGFVVVVGRCRGQECGLGTASQGDEVWIPEGGWGVNGIGPTSSAVWRCCFGAAEGVWKKGGGFQGGREGGRGGG